MKVRSQQRKLARRQLSMCSEEEFLNLSEDDTSDNEGSVTTNINKAVSTGRVAFSLIIIIIY